MSGMINAKDAPLIRCAYPGYRLSDRYPLTIRLRDLRLLCTRGFISGHKYKSMRGQMIREHQATPRRGGTEVCPCDRG